MELKAAEIIQCTEAAEDFIKLYYEKMDKQRHVLKNMYVAEASVIWNGNEKKGLNLISEFHTSLPISTSYVNSIDAQPIHSDAYNSSAILIAVLGTTRYTGQRTKEFAQTFILQKVGDKNTMKIAHDSYRFLNDG